MTHTEEAIDYSAFITQDTPYKDQLDQEQRQEYQTQKARWQASIKEYRKDPAHADMICTGCMRRLDIVVGFGVHLNIIMLQAEVKCLACVEKSPRTDWYTLVKEL